MSDLGQSFEEQAAQLLAEIADLLLNGKQDWQTLERLQTAMYSPVKPSAIDEAVKEIYGPVILSQVRDSEKFAKMVWINAEGMNTSVYNGSQWSYSAKRNRKNGPNGKRRDKT